MALNFDGGQGPVGFGLAPGQTDTWYTPGGIPYGLTSFWTAMALSGKTGDTTVEVSHVYHETTDAGLIIRYVEVYNRGPNDADYALIWAQSQT